MTIEPAITSLSGLLADRAEKRPGLIVGMADDQVTLRNAVGLAAGLAAHLISTGLRPGSRVAMVGQTSTEYLLTWMACQAAGYQTALVNPTYPDDLLALMLDHLDPTAVFVEPKRIHRAQGPGQSFWGRRPVHSLNSIWGVVVGDVSGAPGHQVSPDSIASFMHTSGTTGVPKFCAQSHEYFLRLGKVMAGAMGLTSQDSVLAPLPLFHINPLGYGVMGALTAGANVLGVPRFSASGFWPLVREHGITALVMHAPPVEILKRATTREDANGHQVRTMFYADREFMNRFGIVEAVSGYGSTEAGGVTHLKNWSVLDDLPADAGRYGGTGREDVDWRLDGQGKIEVKGRARGVLFEGYWANGALDPALDDDGWFATDDFARRTASGELVFTERAAESIRVRGEFVPIPFVEDQLATIDALDDYAIWKRPGELVDDEVVLYAVGAHIPVEGIRSRIAGLAPFMRPVVIAHVDSIPRDAAAGKAQRRLLNQQEVKAWIPLS